MCQVWYRCLYIQKTARVSDIYYNKGLEKARVRDLSGAIETLKVSLMINKYNINARNLLGLIYCEMGEVVEALSQWVMSKNLAPDDNVAESYIKKSSLIRISLNQLLMLLRNITYRFSMPRIRIQIWQ